MDAIMEMVLKLSVRCPLFAQALLKQHEDFRRLIERYSKENPTLPVGASKIRIFKEGQIRWNDIKSSFLNQQSKSKSNLCLFSLLMHLFLYYLELDWITNYTRARTARFIGHLKRTPQEQARVAKLCGVNDFRLANYDGLQTGAENEPGQGVGSAALNASMTSAASSSSKSAT